MVTESLKPRLQSYSEMPGLNLYFLRNSQKLHFSAITSKPFHYKIEAVFPFLLKSCDTLLVQKCGLIIPEFESILFYVCITN